MVARHGLRTQTQLHSLLLVGAGAFNITQQDTHHEYVTKMDLQYPCLEEESEAMKDAEEISEQECNDEEDRSEEELASTDQNCCYCLGRIFAYITYVSPQQLLARRWATFAFNYNLSGHWNHWNYRWGHWLHHFPYQKIFPRAPGLGGSGHTYHHLLFSILDRQIGNIAHKNILKF